MRIPSSPYDPENYLLINREGCFSDAILDPKKREQSERINQLYSRLDQLLSFFEPGVNSMLSSRHNEDAIESFSKNIKHNYSNHANSRPEIQ